MVEEAQNKIQGAMESLIDDIDKSNLRLMQKSMHLCAAKCCDNKLDSVKKVQRCTEQCSTPLHAAQTFVQTELSQFQERLQRCVMVCQDKVKERVTSNTDEAQVGIYTAQFETCAMHCVDEHIKLMPSLRKRVQETVMKSTGR